MRIIRNDREGTWIFTFDQTLNERGYRLSLNTLGVPGRPILYLGRTSDGLGARFKVDVVTIELHGTTRTDREIIGEMCRICRVSEGGTGGLIFVDQGLSGAVVLTGARCSGCNKYMIDFESCKARRCASCRAKVPVLAH